MPRIAKNPRARLHQKAAALAKAEATSDKQHDFAAAVPAPEQPAAAAHGPTTHQPSKEKKMRHVVQSKLPEHERQYMRDGQPYSKSHMKRLKRKARDQLAGGDLASLAAQLGRDEQEDDEEQEEAPKRRKKPLTPEEKAQRAAERGKIGQGKGRTLKEDQRRKQITINRTHMAAVMQNPAFKKDPFAAIRVHAANSLAMQNAK